MIHKAHKDWTKGCSCGAWFSDPGDLCGHVEVQNQNELNRLAVELARMVDDGISVAHGKCKLAHELLALAEACGVTR